MFAKKIVSKLYSPRWIVTTNTVTGVATLGLADIIQQSIEKYGLKQKCPPNYDLYRMGCVMSSGLYFGYVGHYWYELLDKRFVGTSRPAVLKKLACESVFGPFYVAVPFLYIRLVEGHGLQKSWQDLKSNFNVICAAEWLFFVPMQVINFFYLPTRFRVLYVCALSLIYDIFLSFILHKDDSKKR